MDQNTPDKIIVPIEYDLREEARVLSDLIGATSSALGALKASGCSGVDKVGDDLIQMVARARAITCPKQ